MFRAFAVIVAVVVAAASARADDATAGAVREPPRSVRVFMAPLKVGAGADKDVVALFEERVLFAARRHDGFSVVGGSDVASIVDLEANRQASGCEGEMSCAAEIAGALDAPQLVTGQLGRVGDTWVMTLTRTERASLTVLARVVRESHGSTPEGLLGTVDAAVDELFGSAAVADHDDGGGVSFAAVFGGVGVGVGVVGLGLGTVAAFSSWGTFNDASSKLNDEKFSKENKLAVRESAIKDGETSNTIAVACWIGGGVLVGVGVGGIALGVWGGE